jgi:phage protein D
MLTYVERWQLVVGGTPVEYGKRVRVAAIQYALDVKGEAKTGQSATRWAKRDHVADRLLQISTDNDPLLAQFKWACAALAGFDQINGTDADFFAAVAAAYNDIAGVNADDNT